MRSYIFLLGFIGIVKVSFTQAPNIILRSPTDFYEVEIFHNPIYWVDSVRYSNGATVKYTYDSLGNRLTHDQRRAPALAELRVLSALIPDTLGLGTSNFYPCEWRNSGYKPVSSGLQLQLQVFLSTDSIWDPGDTVLAGKTSYPNGNFAIETTETIPTLVDIPGHPHLANKMRWLIFYIDDNTKVDEYSDSNNTFAVKVFLSPCGSSPNITSKVTDELCNNQDGSISVSLPDSFAIRWFNGSTDTIVSGLSTGMYSYELTSFDNNCTFTDSISVDATPDLEVDVNVTRPNCNQNNGKATVNLLNGTPPYRYYLDGNLNTTYTGTFFMAENLAQGSYIVEVNDSMGCGKTFTIDIVAVLLPFVQINSTKASCGVSGGTATAEVSHGVPPYTYLWSNGDSSQTATQLSDRTYFVTVTDASGCTKTESVTLRRTPPADVEIEQDGNNLTAIDNSGTAPLSFEWSTGSTNKLIAVAQDSSYSVTMTDANGCQDVATIDFTSVPDLDGLDRVFLVYPNPSDGSKIKLKSGIRELAKVAVVDQRGRFLFEQKVARIVPQEVELDWRFETGLYFLIGKDEKGHQVAVTQFVVH